MTTRREGRRRWAATIGGVILLVTIGAPTAVRAQINAGVINGIVKDESNAVLPGVTVTAKNTATGQSRAVTTNESGRYQIPGLQPGDYSMTAELTGFGTVARSGLTVEVGSAIDVDITMKVASVSETVTVTGAAPLLESTRTDTSVVVNQQTLENLPSRQKVYLDFTLQMPAATQTVSTVQGTGATIGGMRSYQGALLIDGFNNFDEGFNMPKQMPSQDAVQEFQVIEFGGAPEYGRAIGGIINAVTKSGGNEISGSGYGYFRNNSLNSEPFEEKYLGAAVTDYHRYQEGGTFGGPIVKNQTFYFASFEKVNENWPYGDGITPTNAALIGLPPSDTTAPRHFADTYAMGKIDQNISATSRLAFNFSYTKHDDDEMCCLQALSTGSAAYTLYATDWLGSASWNHVDQSGRRMQDLKISYFPRYYGTLGNSAGEGPPLAPAGQLNQGVESNTSPPTVTIGGVATFGSVSLSDRINTYPVEAIYTSSVFVNKHTVKFGVDYYYAYYDYSLYSPLHGAYTFSSIPNFLVGKYSQYSQSFGASAAPRHHQLGSVFLQDQWNINSRTTLNYGLRYDIEFNPCPNQGGTCFGNVYRDIGPRGAISYDLTGDGKTFLKVNGGLYYDRNWDNLDNFYTLLGHQDRFSYTWTPTSPGAPVYPNVFASAPPNVSPALSNALIQPSPTRDPMSAQTVATLERSLASDLALRISAIGIKTWWDPYQIDTNLLWNGAAFVRPNPAYRQITQYVYAAPASYVGGFVDLKKRGVRAGFDGNFTVQRANQTGTSFANDPRLGINGDLGPVPDVPTERFVSTGWYNVTQTVQVSFNFLAQGGLAVNPVDTGVDLLGTGVTGTRTPGLAPFSFRTPPRNSLDLRLTWAVPLGGNNRNKLHLSLEAYNVYNRANVEAVNSDYGGVTGSPLPVFLTPTAYFQPREVQLGIRYVF